MDNEQFQFGKFSLIIHNKGQPQLNVLHITAVIISCKRASLSFKPSNCYVVTLQCTSRTLTCFFIFRKCVFFCFFFQYVQCNLWLCSLSFATWQHGSIMIIIIFIWVEFVAHTVFFVNMWAERRTMNGNCTAWNDFTVYSTELLNWLSFLWQNSCSHTDKELKQDEKWPWPKLSSCYIEIIWCCFLRSSGMHLALPEISVKFPTLQGSHYLPYISTFHRVGTSKH